MNRNGFATRVAQLRRAGASDAEIYGGLRADGLIADVAVDLIRACPVAPPRRDSEDDWATTGIDLRSCPSEVARYDASGVHRFGRARCSICEGRGSVTSAVHERWSADVSASLDRLDKGGAQ